LIRLFVAALLLALATPAWAQPEIVRLWPHDPPGHGRSEGPERIGTDGAAAGSYTNINPPRMEVYRPAHPDGSAVLVIGGGGYFRIQIDSAARPIARWLQRQGVTAIVLFYRLPGDGWNEDAPFQDGQRAMRLIRANAGRLGIDPHKLGVMGSSAGGHLAGILATRGDHDFYPRIDAADAGSATPDFAALIYPVVSMRPPLDTTRTARHLANLPNFAADYSIEEHVSATTPPVFLAHAADDPIANVGHSLAMLTAMRGAGRPVELHIFQHGGHSWGLGQPGSEVAAWPALFIAWARANGFMPSATGQAQVSAERGE
jgi:acetyl esterase/lipase